MVGTKETTLLHLLSRPGRRKRAGSKRKREIFSPFTNSGDAFSMFLASLPLGGKTSILAILV